MESVYLETTFISYSWENDVMWEDPIVSDVRRAREELSARFDFDVTAIFADIRDRQAALRPRLVSRRKQAEPVVSPGLAPKEKEGRTI